MSSRGAIIVLAYPDLFVKATDGHYNRILKKIGIVNADLVRAGHAAALLVENNGNIHYTDFGRYITPGDHGRARAASTDPEVRIDVHTKFSTMGTISNLDQILEYIETIPDITHGSGRLYAGVFYDADIDTTLSYARELSLKGSLPYGPFVFSGSNCARYVWSLLWKGLGGKVRARLLMRLWPSPMPLDLVMCTEVYNRFEVRTGEPRPFSMNRWPIWRRLFERPGSEHLLHIDKSELFDGSGTWLGGVGEGAWFDIEESLSEAIRITRRNERGKVIFSEWFSRPRGLNVHRDYRFVHDSNAQYCHIEQDDKLYKLDKLQHLPSVSTASAVGSGQPAK